MRRICRSNSPASMNLAGAIWSSDEGQALT